MGTCRTAAPRRKGAAVGAVARGSLERLRGGRLRLAAAAREVALADFGKRLRLLARPGVGSARYLCGEGGVGSGRMGDELSHYAGRGGETAAAVPGAGWLSDAPRGVRGAALARGSLCPARCPAENDGLEGTKEIACCW